MLFLCRTHPQQSAGVEVLLRLPPQICGDAELELLCGGYVSRILNPKSPLARTAVAVAFSDFRLLFPEDRPSVRARQAQHLSATRPGADLIHQLNNQIAVTLGTCELLLQRGQLEPEMQKGLQQIRDSAERAAALIREL